MLSILMTPFYISRIVFYQYINRVVPPEVYPNVIYTAEQDFLSVIDLVFCAFIFLGTGVALGSYKFKQTFNKSNFKLSGKVLLSLPLLFLTLALFVNYSWDPTNSYLLLSFLNVFFMIYSIVLPHTAQA